MTTANDVCPICQESIDGATFAWPACGHAMHAACALSWAQYDITCPVCRERVPNVEKRTLSIADVLSDLLGGVSVETVREDDAVTLELEPSTISNAINTAVADLNARRNRRLEAQRNRRRIRSSAYLTRLDQRRREQVVEERTARNRLQAVWNDRVRRSERTLWNSDAEVYELRLSVRRARNRLSRTTRLIRLGLQHDDGI